MKGGEIPASPLPSRTVGAVPIPWRGDGAVFRGHRGDGPRDSRRTWAIGGRESADVGGSWNTRDGVAPYVGRPRRRDGAGL